MAAHTPGPWSAKLSASRMWHIHGQPDPAVKQSRGAVAFTAQTYSEAGMRTSAANARLIAAAPDLLVTLAEIAAKADLAAAACDNEGAASGYLMLAADARAAIAKATGQTGAA